MRYLVCRWEVGAIEALLSRGVDVVLLIDAWEAEHRHLDPGITGRLERLIRIDSFEAMDELALLVTGLQEEGLAFDRVLSVCERGQFAAAYLAALLGLGRPTIVQSVQVRDKRAMKTAVRRLGVPTARFTTVPSGDPGAAARHVEREIGFPAVVKPVAGAGVVSTARVGTARELEAWLAVNAADGQFMAEQMIDGEEFHVDAVWVDGKAWEFAVSRYLRPRIELDDPGHLNGAIQLPAAREPELYAAVEELHSRVNEALEITDGITHTELFRSPDGSLWFSEIATRPGGGGTTQAFRARGADLREVWAESLVSPDRRSQPLSEPPHPYIGWVMLTPRTPGRITREPADAEISAFPYVLDVDRTARVGDVVWTNSLAPGMTLVIGADSEEQFTERVLVLESALVLETTPADGAAA
ncbi:MULTISPECIES: acetyl-CoA carboxylase biotin carboxylase subunit family protein [unclassified Streptomyces]|uniref:ATP-grasp domain-containing protein n=1 Tax=unclassified Streptomyces TaxID=2593676 RepID=UPI000D13AF99|nr:ATP-grasp domain-containing protein [Streptomyces sp. PCS3-D2]WKV72876.1 ATP-grasp domain-containing protein [Streptomyces sp. PCS3-D2]